MSYLIYLRKSRADLDAEARGEGETLARHETQLLELSHKRGLEIGAIYKEIVSGDSIAARPYMQKLISEVSEGVWDGVIVMEIERLARGDTIDQGIVSQAFTYSGTKIITPNKVYDPLNEADQEYFEFSLFMSRREYKTINRRMQAGRIASIKEGNYIGSFAPYGYKKVHDYEKRVFTLEENPDEAPVVRTIFEMCAEGKGPSLIANFLNTTQVKPRKSDAWSPSTIRDILNNPIYHGQMRWNWRKTKKSVVDGRVVISRPKSEEDNCLLAKGNFEPIISDELYQKAQDCIAVRKQPHTSFSKPLKNPFATLMYCGLCGHSIIRRPYADREPVLYCKLPSCSCVGSDFSHVEQMVMTSLGDGYKKYMAMAEKNELHDSSNDKEIAIIKAELKKAEKQQLKLYDLLEQEIYTPQVFTERNIVLSKKISELKKQAEELTSKSSMKIHPLEAALSIKKVIDDYSKCETIAEQNDLLKTVCRRIVYKKTAGGRWHASNAEIMIEFVF